MNGAAVVSGLGGLEGVGGDGPMKYSYPRMVFRLQATHSSLVMFLVLLSEQWGLRLQVRNGCCELTKQRLH